MAGKEGSAALGGPRCSEVPSFLRVSVSVLGLRLSHAEHTGRLQTQPTPERARTQEEVRFWFPIILAQQLQEKGHCLSTDTSIS